MTVQEIDAAPSLLPLYAKAAVGGVLPTGKGGDRLPTRESLRRDIVVDPGHLAAYNEVCGFRLDNHLPATYPHVLAFAQQVSLMTESDFPFPLLGMVHIGNRITQHRPIAIDEPFSLRVRTENLRDHEKGRQFDVISELSPGRHSTTDGDGDGPIWTDVSTYLRRGGGSGAGKSKRDELTPPEPTTIWRVPGDIGRRYAEVSGDRNPIHLHPLTAKAFGFPSAIAHGMWTKAHSLAAFEGELPPAFTIDVRFKQPILLPAKAGFTTWRADSGEHGKRGGWAFELWNARKPKPHLDGTITAL